MIEVIIASSAAIFLLLFVIFPSISNIGQTEVGLVSKRFGKRLPDENPIAMHGEAGYQAKLLMPGFRFKLWFLYSVKKFPWVQVPAGEIGVVISQTGKQLPIGAKSGIYKPEFGNFVDLEKFLELGGEKGVQRPVLSPGSSAPIHPVAFLVITKKQVYGLPIDPNMKRRGSLTPESFNLKEEDLDVYNLSPDNSRDKRVDMIGIVTVYEGAPLDSNDIAGRLGGFSDIAAEQITNASDDDLIEMLLGSKNKQHNNYQDFQAFITCGGRIGLQHDPLLYGAYTLNPFLVRVEKVPMLIVEQGQVAVIKSYVGLVTTDTSGADFKFGSLVKPGCRGIWRNALRTGKYPINPHCYQAEIVPTSILTLNWSDAASEAHNLDANLKKIIAKSNEGFVFELELQVQIHIPDTEGSRVISMVGTISNLVNEVLQAAVGNHFRDKLQSIPAVKFIETRQQIQEEAFAHIKEKLNDYRVETRGVYIQDVILPATLVVVLTEREVAKQQISTYQMKQLAQVERILTEKAEGEADRQKDLASSKVNIEIKKNDSQARVAEGEGEASYLEKVGTAKGAEVRSIGLAKAEGFEAQKKALGETNTALISIFTAISEGKIQIMPNTLIVGGGNGGSSSMEGLFSAGMNYFQSLTETKKEEIKPIEEVKE